MIRSLILVLLLIAAPAWADPLELTSGHWSVSVFGTSLSFAADGLSGHVVGDLFDLGLVSPGVPKPFRLDFFAPGNCGDRCAQNTLTWEGVTYQGNEDSAGFGFLVTLTGVVTIPPESTALLLDTTGPITLSGRLGGPFDPFTILGHGTYTMHFAREIGADGHDFERYLLANPNHIFGAASADFGPVATPEPSSIVLLFLGLALLAVGRHVKTPSRAPRWHTGIFPEN